MPFCPGCKAEYVEGIKICADCEIPLVAVLAAEPREEDPGEPVAVCETDSRIEAAQILSLMEESGIPARLDGNLILVMPGDLNAAREAVTPFIELDMVCPACGIILRPNARFCDQCGVPILPTTAPEPAEE